MATELQAMVYNALHPSEDARATLENAAVHEAGAKFDEVYAEKTAQN